MILDDNWITPSALARELDVTRQAVSNWIRRGKIEYYNIPSADRQRYLVDRRTAPEPAKVKNPNK